MALALGAVGYVLAPPYHPGLERRDALIVPDTDTTSIRVQWPGGQVSERIWTKTWQRCVWPVW